MSTVDCKYYYTLTDFHQALSILKTLMACMVILLRDWSYISGLNLSDRQFIEPARFQVSLRRKAPCMALLSALLSLASTTRGSSSRPGTLLSMLPLCVLCVPRAEETTGVHVLT